MNQMRIAKSDRVTQIFVGVLVMFIAGLDDSEILMLSLWLEKCHNNDVITN